MSRPPRVIAITLIAATTFAACSGDDSADEAVAEAQPSSTAIDLVTPTEAAAMLAEPAADLVLLDVRTQEEFDAGHIDGAIMIDIGQDDFEERIAELDPEVPYVVYCRTGNRSARATALMAETGFTDVTEIAGGTVGWSAAGLPLVAG